MKYSRNKFLKLAGLTGVASLTLPHVVARNPSLQKKELTLGLASYTLRNFKLEDVIKMTQRLQLKSLALKSMHMPLDSSPDDLRNAATQVSAAGLKLYGAGVIYMKTAQEVENAFTYASHAGLEVIIGVPDHALLPLVNKLVEKYNIRLAIHNHGPGDDLYRSPDDVYAKVRALDKRIGLCIDIGHVVRIGQDPVPMIEKYQDRLYDLHVKDVDKA